MDSQAKPNGWEQLRVWVAAIAIPVVAAGLALWQFYLKEVWWPAAAAKLTTEVRIRDAGLNGLSAQAAGLQAIEVSVSAKNPSSSTVFLCANFWQATGITVAAPGKAEESWAVTAIGLINNRTEAQSGKHYRKSNTELVAIGTVFPDKYLRANETVSRAFIFYVPPGRYDTIEVSVSLPTTTMENPERPGEPAIENDYVLRSQGPALNSLFRMTAGETREDIARDVGGALLGNNVKDYGYQTVVSIVSLSLWTRK